MTEPKLHIYGIHLESKEELSEEESSRLEEIFRQTAEAITELKIKGEPEIKFPVKPPKPQ